MLKSGNLGLHILVDFLGCEPAKLADTSALKELILRVAHESGATVVTDVFHTFNPYGVSGVVVIAESHVTIHTWPEHGVASIDIFTCSDKMDPQVIIDGLHAHLGARERVISQQARGQIRPRGQVSTRRFDSADL